MGSMPSKANMLVPTSAPPFCAISGVKACWLPAIGLLEADARAAPTSDDAFRLGVAERPVGW